MTSARADSIILMERADRVVAGAGWRPRKVRTPQGRELGNAQAGKPDGKCHRKGNRPLKREGKGEKVG